MRDRALKSGRILPAAAVAQLFAPAVNVNDNMNYGYGWMLSNSVLGIGLVIHHPGDLGGFNAELRRYAEDDIVFVLLSNARSAGRSYRDVAILAWNALLAGRPLSGPAATRAQRAGGTEDTASAEMIPRRAGRNAADEMLERRAAVQ